MTLLASNYKNDPIDVLAGDWMSEGNMTVRAGTKINGRVPCDTTPAVTDGIS